MGAVYEHPKKVLTGFCFQIESAVRNIPRGQGADVALKAITAAFGVLSLNVYFGGVDVLKRKVCIAGPHRPNESSASGRRIMLLFSKSPITSSPRIVSILFLLSSRLNFFRSNVCRCASARADIDVMSAEQFNREGILERLLPIVISAPIVVYGQ